MQSMKSRPGAERVRAMPRSGIRRILERAGSPDVVNLAAGDPNFDTPQHVVVAAGEALARGATHYTHGRGLLELREAWADKMAAENGVTGLDPATDIVVTAGALNALSASFLALVNPGDRVLLPDPGFANYQAQVLLAEGTPVGTRYPHSLRFAPDLDALGRAAAGARVMVVNTPGNPTGAVLDGETLGAIAEIATTNDLIVIADEAYEHLVYDGARHISLASLPGMAERTLTISSMSKSWAMTGWRVGFVTGPADILELIAKAQEHLIGCPPAMTQWAALAALTGPTAERDAMIARYTARRNRVVRALSGLERIDLVAPLGAFYAFPRIDVAARGVELAEYLLDQTGVLSVPGAAFGDEGARHVRLSYACDDDALDAGLSRIRAWAEAPTGD